MDLYNNSINYIIDRHNYISYDMPGLRFKDRILYGSPLPSFLIVATYCYFCINRGKKMMEKREPMTLKKTMIIYNIVQVFANLYVVMMFVKAMTSYWYNGGNLRCLIKNENYNTALPLSQYNHFVEDVDHLTYVYALIKFSDLFDTIFMVLKKNFHQISVLHVYHHAMMAVSVIFLYKFYDRTFDLYTGTSNAFIHVIMYGYYLASVYNPDIKKSLTLKKSITLMQLSQFVFTFFITVYMSVDSGCRISNFLTIYFLFQTFMMISLFSNFFYRTYIKKKPKKDDKIKEH